MPSGGIKDAALPRRLLALLLESTLLAALLLPTSPAALGEGTARAADPTTAPQPSGEATGPEVLVAGPAVAGTPTEPGFTEEVVWSGLDDPTAIAFAANGRVYVLEKRGVVKEFDSLTDTSPTTWADFRTQVHNWWDRGALGLALDPSFTTNRRLYVSYTHDAVIGGTAPRWGTAGADGDACSTPPGGTEDGCVVSSRISAFTHPSGSGLATEQVLVEDWCQQYPSHSAGDLAIGPDGYLYGAGGDGASFTFIDYGQGGDPYYPGGNPCEDPPGGTMSMPTAEGGMLRSQDVRTATDPTGLDGTIIRIDRTTGAGVTGNPLFASSDANERRIVAYGLRNPFRMAFRPGTSELWIGDVGMFDWEEINRLADTTPPTSPVNFGWPCREGNGNGPSTLLTSNLCSTITGQIGPYYTYLHGQPVSDPDCGFGASASISGLAFYEGDNYPASYEGALFFSDYSRACIWVMRAGGSGLPSPAQVEQFADASGPVQLKMGPDGNLFYVDLSGSIRRIKYQAPVADIQASPTSGASPLAVAFDASGSTPSGLTYAWDLDGDGAYDDSTAVAPGWTYNGPGQYTARLLVSNGSETDTDSVVIAVDNHPPEPDIATPSASLTWAVGDVIGFSGSATDPEEGTLPAADLDWTLVMAHCPSDCHEHTIQSWSGVASGSFVAPDHDYPAHLVLRLTATDELGAEATVSIDLQPKTATVWIRSSPTGLQLAVGGAIAPTPYAVTAIVGGGLSINAPVQSMGGVSWTFGSWSDGGAAAHDILVGPTGATLEAAYLAGFSDIGGSIFAAEIQWAAATGLTSGCGGGRFCPTATVTREQMAAFLVRALDLADGASPDAFSDIASSPFRADINRLAAAGITAGCGGGRFCPGVAVTRDQMASFLVRAFGYAAGATPDQFSDIASSIHRLDINRLATAGITSGCGGGRYCPLVQVTREQMVAFLYRALR